VRATRRRRLAVMQRRRAPPLDSGRAT
jgi:hypothetical protein